MKSGPGPFYAVFLKTFGVALLAGIAIASHPADAERIRYFQEAAAR